MPCWQILPCQHTFCLACLGPLVDRSQVASSHYRNGTLTCPVCRAVAYVPARGLTRLPDDFRAGQIGTIVWDFTYRSFAVISDVFPIDFCAYIWQFCSLTSDLASAGS